jgi:penicillin-binding protein 2
MSYRAVLAWLLPLIGKLRARRNVVRPVRPAAERAARLKDPIAERRLFFRRALFSLALVLGDLLALVGRLAYLQVLNHEHFATLSENNRVKLQPLPPTRGRIFDRNGVLLADNLSSRHLEITPEEVDDLDATLEQLEERITVSAQDIARFHRLVQRSPSSSGIPLRFNLNDEEVARLAVDLYRFPGVEIKADLTRYYPLGSQAAHIIGYVGRIDEAELQRIDPAQYAGITHIGKIGVEHSYEDLLHGQAGYQQVETNAEGRSLRVLEQTPPVPGKNLYLSIDIRLQAVAEQALEGYNGAVVAIDPRNGEVLAMASMPVYDPNPFVNGIDHAAYKALSTSPNRPLLNRALRGIYPPGSTIKPFIALTGLQTHSINPRTVFNCGGAYYLPGQSHVFRCWKHSGHGAVSLDRGISQSCDVYFYNVALHVGIDHLHDYLTQFSLGERTGIDLAGENTGLMPSEEWKRAKYNQPWYTGETLNVGIGQGYLQVTPLQLASAVATMSQRGQRFQPRLLHATQEQSTGVIEPKPPRPLEPVQIKDSHHWDAVITGMIHVVQGGTASRIGVGTPYTIAGKTGTAQVFSLDQGEKYNAKRLAKNLQDHALFIAFAPAEAPRIAVAVVAEHGGHGSSAAAPIAKQVLDAYLLNKQ